MKIEVDSFDDMDFQKSTKEYTFEHRFNDYVRLTLTKDLPPKCKDIKICPRKNIIVGPPKEC